MIGHYHVCYLVEPKPSLSELKFPTQALREFMCASRLWMNDEGGQSDLLPSQRVVIAKVLCLTYYLRLDEADLLLNRPSICDKTFDRFWSIRRLEAEGDFSHLRLHASKMDYSRFEVSTPEFGRILDRLLANAEKNADG